MYSSLLSQVRAALRDMYVAHIESHTWEVGAKFWCYFCKHECEKHEVLDEVTVRNSGIIQHLAR